MIEYISIRMIPSVVSEPDYVGPNETGISPTKMLIAILIVSIAICSIAMNLLADYMTPLAHVFWLFFHIFYIGGLVVYFVLKRNQRSQHDEV